MHFCIQFIYIKHSSLHSIELFLDWYEIIEPNKVTYYKSRVVTWALYYFTPVQHTYLL